MLNSLKTEFRHRAKIVSIGFTEAEAEYYEKELDKGKVLVIAQRGM